MHLFLSRRGQRGPRDTGLPYDVGVPQWRFIGTIKWDPGGRPDIYVQRGSNAPTLALADTGPVVSLIKIALSEGVRTKPTVLQPFQGKRSTGWEWMQVPLSIQGFETEGKLVHALI